mgnify:CR=1 FL=1
MLNTHKLLYILPDVAYVAELLPSKKPATFSISSFLQINGNYMDDNEFIAENILKLFKKIDPEEYQLILPDFLFTNTIVNVKEKSDTKIKAHLTEKLLPSLDLSPETHQIDTTILNEHGGETRIQLSALEKSLLEPLQVSAAETKVKIKTISPLSWSIKSLVSLEPSISVVQIDSMLYIALHYIGVDQANQAKVEQVENIYETIKTLKGAEPSIQTIYLLSNELVEEKLKEHLSDTLPIQQLASKQDEESKMPSYVKKIIESSMRTLSISDYPVPQFELGTAPSGAKIKQTSSKPAAIETVETEEKADHDSDLPKPQKAPEDSATAITIPTTKEESPTMTAAQKKEDDEIETLLADLQTDDKPEKAVLEKKAASSSPTTPKKKGAVIAEASTSQKPPQIIKNKDKTKTMLKMVFVTLAVFFTTVAVGIGIGLGVLRLTQPSTNEEPLNPVVATSPSPIPSPTPSPSPVPEIDTTQLSVLVVNATTKAGYAGEIADLLTDFESVKAGNAKGDYDPGLYVLMNQENSALISELETTTELEYVYQEKDSVEDPKDQYDAVIVLAK